MDTETIQLKGGHNMMLSTLDYAIEKGLILLLIFTPLAFGTVYQWSISVMEIAAFCILIMFLLKKVFLNNTGIIKPSRRAMSVLIFLFSCLFALFLLQMVPLPQRLLAVLSPSALLLFKKLGAYAPDTLLTISLNPYATRQEFLRFLSYAAVFYVIVNQYKTKEQLQSIIKTIIRIAGFLVIFAIIQKLTWNGRMFWFYPVDDSLSLGTGIWGPYINRNHFAGYLALVIPLALGRLIYSSPDTKTLPGVALSMRAARFLSSENFAAFTLFFLGILIMSANLFMTLSKGGVAALGGASLFFALIIYTRRSLRKRGLLLVLIGVVMLVVVVLAGWDRLDQRFEEIKAERYVGRLKTWEESIGIIKDYPVFGSGFGTFEHTYMPYQKHTPLGIYDHAHNDYLELITDGGFIGGFLGLSMVIIFSLTVYRAWRRRHSKFAKCIGAGGLASIVAIGIHSFVDFNLHIPANALLLTVIAGITYAAVFNPSGDASEDDNSPEPVLHKKSRLFLPALVIAGLVLYLPLRDLTADYHFRKIQGVLDDKTTKYLDAKPISSETLPDYIKALDSLDTASRLSLGRSVYYQATAEIYTKLGIWFKTSSVISKESPNDALVSKGAFSMARLNLEQAIALEPTNPDYHLELGLLYGDALGDQAAAETELNKALEAFPINPAVRYNVAKYYLRTGMKGNALEQARLLAKSDESYILNDTLQNRLNKEQRTEAYLKALYSSYLFRALDIAWLASKDPYVVKGIAPNTPEAEQVVQAYFEWSGTEE